MDPLDWLKMGGLHKHRKRMYAELSSGMQQRVKLALALTSDAGLVVLPERPAVRAAAQCAIRPAPNAPPEAASGPVFNSTH